MSSLEERVAALETWSGQHAEWIVDYGERLAALEAKPVSLPSRNPIGAETRTDTRATRLAEIESELAALALRRGALVGERERLRSAP